MLLSGSVYANKPIVLTDSLEELCVAREFVEYLEDTSREMVLQDVLKLADTSRGFIPSTAQDLINDNTGSAYWLKFRIHNASKTYKPFRIELFDFDIGEISFYYPDTNGVYVEQKAGFNFPFSFRQIGHKNISFIVPSHLKQSDLVFMRFSSRKHNVLEPMIRSYDRTINYSLKEYILFGVFYGLLLLMIFYNLLYFISLRKGYYFYYVLYGFGTLFYLMSKNGTGFQYLWSDFPIINNYTGETGLFIATLSMLLFTNSFLGLKHKAKKLYNVVILGLLLRIGIYGIQLLNPYYYLYELIDVVYIQVVFFVSIKLFKRSIPSAKWLVIAFSLLNASFLISLMEQATVIPSGIFTVYSVHLGIILQFVFLSIGIAETIKEAYKEKNEAQVNLIVQYQHNAELKEKVNKELEQKVRERTFELDQANDELKKRAEENMKMSVALDLANNELKKYISTFARSSVTKSHLNFDEFKKAYPDESSCIRYLKDLKEGYGFLCIKCGNDRSIKGKAKFDVRCSKCNYNESLTAHTIFHRTKFPLQKAFYMLYLVSQKNGKITAVELSRVLELQTATCQNFKSKILKRLHDLKRSGHKDHSWDSIIMDRKTQSVNNDETREEVVG